MPLFEVAIIEKPTKKERDDGAKERLVLGPKAVIAASKETAGIAAAVEATKDLADLDFGRCEVLVRPFA